MASKKSIVRKLIFAYLFLCAAGVLAYVVVELYDRFGPSKLVVEGIPFGLPAGTELAVGDLLVVGDDGYLTTQDKAGEKAGTMRWQVVKVYTMPDHQRGVKIMRVA